MRVLGLDLATRTGWSVTSVSGAAHTNSGVLHSTRGGKALGLEDRLCQFRFKLDKMLDTYMPDVVCYEIAHFRGGAATRSAVGMETVLKMECYLRGVPCLGVHSLTLKKFATGSGRADKSLMISAASKLVMRQVKDDNEADAICIAEWGKEHAVIDQDGRVTLKNVTAKKKPRRK